MPENPVFSLQARLAPEDLQTIIDGVAERLAKMGQKPKRHRVAPAAFGAYEACRYLGVSRARFYELLMVDQVLADAAIVIGTKRLWSIVFLDAWMAKQQGQKIVPRLPAGQSWTV